MSQLTYAQLITRAGLLAGDDTLTNEARFWVNEWLRKAYAMWPWPFLVRSLSGLVLASGSQAVSIGAGSGGVTNEITRIRDPIIMYNGAYTFRGQARVQTLTGNNADNDERGQNPATFKGIPKTFKARPSAATEGKIDLIPLPFPDRDLILALDYFEMPAPMSVLTTSNPDDATRPRYPNDRTIIQGIYAEMLKYSDGEGAAYAAASEKASAMVSADFVTEGSKLGINQSWPLDESVYRDT